jgi:hypothetical protein
VYVSRPTPLLSVDCSIVYWLRTDWVGSADYNLANKLPTGTWYSTLGKGECGNPAANGVCDWRVVRRVKMVRKKCQEAFVLARVEQVGSQCFAGCGGGANVTRRGTKCWTNCFYDTVIGPRSNGTVYTDGTKYGMKAADLTNAWLAAFKSADPSEGGCPDVAVPPAVTE